MLLEPFYEEINHKILTSEIAGFDETRYSVDEKNGWCWIAKSNSEAQYVLDYSRGRKVIKKHWKKFRRVVISDRWRPYVTVFSHNSRQRCTAHLKRESKDVSLKSKNNLAKILYDEFSEILFYARIFCKLNHKKIQQV
ncbi:MAG: hypothetical protein MAG458_01234 [Nitrosopumilus sp.]|nr:hypothetical protein [Nitrosopumilus sp.]